MTRLETFFAASPLPQLVELRREVDNYWESFAPVFNWTLEEKRARSSSFLRRQVMPKRDAALSLADQIGHFHDEAVRRQEQGLAASEHELKRFVLHTMLTSASLGIVIAIVTIGRLSHLERRADGHRQASEKAEAELRRLSHQLVHLQEEERRALSRELHDEVGQSHLRARAHAAVAVSHFSIIVPFVLGVVAAFGLYAAYAPLGTPFHAFAMFLGIAMSITAFPVLARILDERQLTNTPLGVTAITCAAVDDVTAWSLLAFIVTIVTAGGAVAILGTMLGLSVVFVLGMFFVVRPLLARMLTARRAPQGLSRDRLESFSSVFLLPLFFVYTGLRTEIGLLNTWDAWITCLMIIGIATAGKLGGTVGAARVMGMSWRESVMLGALMNTRGLMELIVLNIGYDLGILSPEIFTMLVLMALATTAMTGPMLSVATLAWPASRDVPPPRGPMSDEFSTQPTHEAAGA